VVQEIVAARLKYGVDDAVLFDDAFLVEPARHALPILEAIAEQAPGLRLHSPNGLHASGISAQAALAMKKAGFVTVRIGLESASDGFHSRTGGKTSRAQFAAAINNLKAAGFSSEQIGVYLLVGLPGQSRAQIEDDVETVLNVGAHPKLAEYSPIPGTAMWREALRSSKLPIADEPLFHNCTLLAAAEPEVDSALMQQLRRRIRESLGSIGETVRTAPFS
jgi:hypothetical protein